MAGRRPAPAAFLILVLTAAFASISSAVRPVSDAHRSAASELFAPSADGSFGDLESTYEAVRTFQILGLDRYKSVTGKACEFAAEKLASPASSSAKDLFHAVRISGVLGCSVDAGVYDVVVARLKAVIKDTNSLLEFYYSVGGLLSIKEQGHNIVLSDAESTFHAIKALSQSDGRWRYDTNSAESSTFAAGIALEALAGVVSLADAEVDPSMIGVVKSDIVKLFDTIKSYDDGTFYFDEKPVDATEYKGPVMTSASVVRGVTAFTAVASGKLNVEVTTVFGSAAPPLKVNLVQVLGSDSKVITSDNKELQFDRDNNVHYLDIAPLKIDVGKYSLVFEISLQEPDHETVYATGGKNTENVFITGLIKVDKAEIGISDNDAGATESVQKLDLSKDTKVSLSANHLQKLRLSFQLTTPLGHTFKPHQVFLKLKHESKVEHLFVVPGSARQFKLVLDFLGLVEKFYYLSGRYELELAVGDAAMLMHLGVNMKNFPSLPGPAAFASLFHAGIGAVLLLYVLFWLKLDLFTTLKYLGFLSVFLVFVGHRTLSYLSSASTKQKTA
nr:unnamed protein product [Digitaria exilis]